MDTMEHPDMDWLDWGFYLGMLSVERLQPFIVELNLPFDLADFPPVMRLARACLEARIFPDINASWRKSDGENLNRPWREYRSADHILSDDAVANLAFEFNDAETGLQGIFERLHSFVGPNLSKALISWFHSSFRTSTDPAWQWPWAFKILLADSETLSGFRRVEQNPEHSITSDQINALRSFWELYEEDNVRLESRFRLVYEAARSEGPTVWEAVLQAYPSGGYGNNYPWLNYIERSLALKDLRMRWRKLTEQLGFEGMARVVAWTKHRQDLLPYNTVLPPPPLEY